MKTIKVTLLVVLMTVTYYSQISAQSSSKTFEQPLDLSDPTDLVESYIRTVGDISGKESFMYASAVVMAMKPEEKGQKLFKLEVIGASRFLKIDGGYQRLHREVGLYTDLETGEVLSSWMNPWHKRDVEVIHIANDPVNFKYTIAQQSTGRKILYDDFGSTIAFHREVLLRYPSALKRQDYPLHSAGDWYVAAELFNSFASRSELEDRSKTSINEFGTWSRIGPWLPWMEMADEPGHLLYHGRSHKLMNGLEELRPGLVNYVAQNFPEYLNAPEVMEEPNQTSWTYFKSVLDGPKEYSPNVNLLHDYLTGDFIAKGGKGESDVAVSIESVFEDRNDFPKGRWMLFSMNPGPKFGWMQALYRLRENTEGKTVIESWRLWEDTVYSPGGERIQVEDLSTLKFTDISPLIGCDVVLSLDKKNIFQGAHSPKGACKNTRMGADYVWAKKWFAPNKFMFWENGFDTNGKVVWGPTDKGYVFRRVKK